MSTLMEIKRDVPAAAGLEHEMFQLNGSSVLEARFKGQFLGRFSVLELFSLKL